MSLYRAIRTRRTLLGDPCAVLLTPLRWLCAMHRHPPEFFEDRIGATRHDRLDRSGEHVPCPEDTARSRALSADAPMVGRLRVVRVRTLMSTASSNSRAKIRTESSSTGSIVASLGLAPMEIDRHNGGRRRLVRVRWSNCHHWDWRRSYRFLGDAPEKIPIEITPAVRPHHDYVDVVFVDVREDLFVWSSL